MTQVQESAHAAAVVCRNLKRWRARAAAEDWQSALDRVTAAALAGTLTSRELDELQQIRDLSWLEHNKPRLRARASDEGYLPDLEAAFDKISAGMSVSRALQDIWPGLEYSEELRRPLSAGRAAMFPDTQPQESDFVCPRQTLRCDRREAREPGEGFPRCALDGDQKLTPVPPRPEPR